MGPVRSTLVDELSQTTTLMLETLTEEGAGLISAAVPSAWFQREYKAQCELDRVYVYYVCMCVESLRVDAFPHLRLLSLIQPSMEQAKGI